MIFVLPSLLSTSRLAVQSTVTYVLIRDIFLLAISCQNVISCALHSDLDASRRLGELKSEFVESPPIKIDNRLKTSLRHMRSRSQNRQNIVKRSTKR